MTSRSIGEISKDQQTDCPPSSVGGNPARPHPPKPSQNKSGKKQSSIIDLNSLATSWHNDPHTNNIQCALGNTEEKNLTRTERGNTGRSEETPNMLPEFDRASVGLLRPVPTPEALAEHLIKQGLPTEFAEKAALMSVAFFGEQELRESAPFCEGPDEPPILYVNRPKGMTPPQFIKTYYGPWLQDPTNSGNDSPSLGQLTRRRLRALDEKAAIALYRWENRHSDDPDLVELNIPTHSETLERQRPTIPDEVVREVFRIAKRAQRLTKS